MPYKSAKQRRFFQMCEHNLGDANKPCPPKKVLKEFRSAETRRARSQQKKRGDVRYL